MSDIWEYETLTVYVDENGQYYEEPYAENWGIGASGKTFLTAREIDLKDFLNDMGDEGWELFESKQISKEAIQIFSGPNEFKEEIRPINYIFKRKKNLY
tara:strand:+ start:621 stop:917 length:297 start_codon:yes stop_codon:yes gene_type:complete